MRHFLSTSLVLALVISGAMVLNYVPQGFTAPSDVETGRVVNLNQASTVPASRYIVSGDQQGQVTVKDAASGAVVRTFQMSIAPGVDIAAEVDAAFLLDDDKTVAASQFGQTVFWDLATGKEIRRLNERIYGFSHDQTKFLSHNYAEGEIFLTTYPELKHSCQLLEKQNFRVTTFLFSLDSRFLMLGFSVNQSPGNQTVVRNGIENKGFVYSKLFDLKTCQEIQEFSDLFVSGGERFSADSKFLYLKDDRIYINGRDSGRGLWRFNLQTEKVEKFAEAPEQANSPLVRTAQNALYWVIKDRQGRVSVRDAATGAIVRNFQMDKGAVVREVFLLDEGKTFAASQKDSTVFWDLATGQEIRRFPQRIYGFSHDEKNFFTYSYPEGLFLYGYPNLTLVCLLLPEEKFGPMFYRFSPDDRFLNISFSVGYPQIDKYYPTGESINARIIYAKLFNIEKCQEIQDFSQLYFTETGEFSADSKFLYLNDELIIFEGQPSRGSWQFDLTTYQVEKLSE